uniref:ATP-dependent Clp protease proteolytic subunit n=1 Tax=Tibetia liangshanensis TaxID=1915067 RepID=A0A291FIA8_9FABA|nr:ATP-dependent Clp protease proteolytic subunit [Tibetia liangshanensis]ATG33778.1 ATP-dependent Clp protease proteolytic subunit [Tibetia liangshanensis]
MPVGIPRVAFQIPGDEDASWVDLYNRTYQERLLFICQEVDAEICNQISGLLIYLSIEDSTRDINLFLNCPGGDVISGLAIYDTMQFVKAVVKTIAIGVAASMGSLILLGGGIGNRTAFEHSRVMIHQPFTSYHYARSRDCILEASEISRMRETMITIYVQRTGQPYSLVAEDINRDRFMSVEEAKDYRIVDAVAEVLE